MIALFPGPVQHDKGHVPLGVNSGETPVCNEDWRKKELLLTFLGSSKKSPVSWSAKQGTHCGHTACPVTMEIAHLCPRAAHWCSLVSSPPPANPPWLRMGFPTTTDPTAFGGGERTTLQTF